MKRLKVWTGAAALLGMACANASQLDAPLTQFFQQRLAGVSEKVSVTVKTPTAQLPDCPQPEFALPNNGRMWGNLSVMVRCGNSKRYIQVAVAASGKYVVAAQRLPRGTTLTASNVTMKYGRLDRLPPRAMIDLKQATNATTLRDISPGQPIMLSMVRQSWRVKAGQQVQVVASGAGFSINSQGKVLNNAAVAQNVRVRMASGQIVNGTVDADGNILINL
ncbi:flagellar basal body P-ring formation chaperone FlgA [Dryocola clanedunensis]|uniref:flagellar basal body P-ring formation chaperone FlgA n=1 Tax=Cedecea sulfonylureivorans TaxID=3051154 RepID=UPI00192583DE